MTLSNVYSSVDCWWLCKAMIQHLGSKFNANIVIQYDAGLVAFLPRDAMHSPNLALARGMAVCLSVRLSHDGILSKRLNTSLKLFSPSGNTPLIFFRTNGMEIFRRWPLPRLTGASNAGGMKNREWRLCQTYTSNFGFGWPWLTLTSDLFASALLWRNMHLPARFGQNSFYISWDMSPKAFCYVFRPRVTLTFWLSKLIVLCPCRVDHLRQFASESVYFFPKYCIHNFGNERTNGRTDERTIVE